MIEPATIHCPYCGEAFETTVDLSAGSQHYIEDCAICCRPIDVTLSVDEDDDSFELSTRSDRE